MSVPTDPQRSKLMARIGRRHTTPERVARSALHRAGLRFRLHRRDLPGTPDIVLAGRRVAIFVHGCFWHRHEGCPRTTTPKRNREFWIDKFERNRERDERSYRRLAAMGWNALVIWECETRDDETMTRLIERIARIPVIGRSPSRSEGRC